MLQQITPMARVQCSERSINIINRTQKTKHCSQKPVSVAKKDFFCVGRPVMVSENTHAIFIKHTMDSPKIMFFCVFFGGEGTVNGISTCHSLTL